MYQVRRAGRLEVEIFESRKAMGEKAARDAAKALKEVIAEKGSCHVVFAAAPSQNEFLEALCHSDVDWSKVYGYHMDEYIGLPADAPQGFGNFLRRAIFDRVPFAHVEYLNGGAEDIQAEARRYGNLLKQNRPDLVFMGIGENGHIAFNDPHVARFDDTQMVKAVQLDEQCRNQQVHDGCFERLDQVPTHALTLTIPALTNVRRIFCMVPAITKAEAVEKTVLGEIRELVPASVLRMHPCATLYVDQDSGSRLLSAGGNVGLRPLTPEDAEAVFELGSRPEIARYMRFSAMKSIEEAKKLMQDYQKGGQAFAVELDGQFKGVYALTPDEEEDGVYSMSTFLAQDLWGKGVSTALAAMIKDYAREKLRAKALTAHVVDANVGSCTVLRRNGFAEQEILHFPDYEHGLIIFRCDL